MTERIPTLVELAQPRALTDAEHAVAARLAAFADVANLRDQVATARVVSTCDCGCASVGLRTDGPQVPATTVARLSAAGRDDYLAVSGSDGGVDVVLHVIGGLIAELEVFAGDGVPVDPPAADGLTNLWMG
jgi:hypothetical protein